jgi:hypothetical protein
MPSAENVGPTPYLSLPSKLPSGPPWSVQPLPAERFSRAASCLFAKSYDQMHPSTPISTTTKRYMNRVRQATPCSLLELATVGNDTPVAWPTLQRHNAPWLRYDRVHGVSELAISISASISLSLSD